ncbi:hypothetical protein MRB53_040169 [Persea americana]|nr:hypothetical protein MRB53_040169 [Persea americana]
MSRLATSEQPQLRRLESEMTLENLYVKMFLVAMYDSTLPRMVVPRCQYMKEFHLIFLLRMHELDNTSLSTFVLPTGLQQLQPVPAFDA